MDDIKEIIKRIMIFDSLPEYEIEKLIDKLRITTYPADTVILQEGTYGDFLYILLSGQVSVTKQLPAIFQYANTEVGVFEPYDYFGEMALLNNYPRPTSCIAKTDCRLLALDKAYFQYLCETYPKLLMELIKTNSRRIVDSNHRYTTTVDDMIKQNRLFDIGTATSKIVHDIQTPISVIILTAEIIAQLHSENKELTDKIIRQANTMTEFIREILDFAKGQKSFLNLTENNLAAFFEEIKEIVDPISQNKQITVTIDNDIKCSLTFDKNKLKRVISNVVKNSIEAIPSHSKISLSSKISNDFWHITIRDNGLGIPLEIVENIFEPFYTKGKEHGTGLGLAICKKIIEDHKGTITLDNHSEGGVIVEIKIPV